MHEVLPALFLTAAAVCAAVAARSWRHRGATPAAAALAVALLAVATWSASAGLLHLGAPPVAERVLLVVEFAAVQVCIAGLACTAHVLSDSGWRPRRRTVLALAVVPALTVAAVATDPWHSLFTASLQHRDGYPELVFGPLFWLHTAYCYGLFLLALARLGRAWWTAPRVFRRQIASIIAAATATTPVNAVTLALPEVFRGVDYTPVLFVATGLVTARAILRQGLLQVVPVARAQVVDTLQDGVLVVDAAGRVVDVNTAGVRMLRAVHADLPAEVVGLHVLDVLRSPRVRALLEGGARAVLEVAPGIHLDLRSSVHVDGRGRLLARVLTARDVTDAVLAERRLREQLATIEALRERLEEDAVRDPLTGLHNRRHLVAVLEAALAAGRPLAAVLLDVDHFKAVNDTHGHAAGDEVLCAVARALLSGVRDGDVVARYGGEEFVVLLPGADAAAALRRAEQVRRSCEAAGAPVAGGAVLRVTVSAGVAVSPADGTDSRALLAAADAALYAAKAAGRNRVALAV